MTENDVNPPINNDPMEKRNEFIGHPSDMCFQLMFWRWYNAIMKTTFHIMEIT